jgi:Ca2+-binding EF-hand superfamily protein
VQLLAPKVDVFELLEAYMNNHSRRIKEAFEEMDHNDSGTITIVQIIRLVMKLIPAVTATHLRFLRTIFEVSGSTDVSYGDFIDTVRDCRRSQKEARNLASGKLSPSLRRINEILRDEGAW